MTYSDHKLLTFAFAQVSDTWNPHQLRQLAYINYWGYSTINPDGTALEDLASAHDLTLLLNPKQPRSFCSARWGTTTNPDLAFANMGLETTHRRVLTAFPKSHQLPSSRPPPPSNLYQRDQSRGGTIGRQTR